MKKGLLSILAGALLVVGCQNYDDQFSALETQINALASTVAGLSQVQSDLASLAGTVNSLQSSLSNQIDTALADGLADIDAAVEELNAAAENAASAQDVEDIQEAIQENQDDLDELLASSNFYDKDLIVFNLATLEFAKNLGDRVAIVNGGVSIYVDEEMAAVDTDADGTSDVQDVLDRMGTITGSFSYYAKNTKVAAVNFNAIDGTGDIEVTQPGDYSFTSLTSAGNITLGDNYKSKVAIVNLEALTTVQDIKTAELAYVAGTTTAAAAVTVGTVGQADGVSFSKATNIHLTALARYPGSQLTLVADDEESIILIDALASVDASGEETSLNITVTGSSALNFSNITSGNVVATSIGTLTGGSDHDGDVTLNKVVNAVLPGMSGTLTVGDTSELATLHVIGGLAQRKAGATADTTYPAVNLTNQTALTSVILEGKLGDITLSGNNNLVDITFTAEADAVSINNNGDLEDLDLAGKAHSIEVTNNGDLIDLDITTELKTDKGNTTKAKTAGSLTITGNQDLSSVDSAFDPINVLTITDNDDLSLVNFAGTDSVGAATDKATVVIGGSANDANAFVATSVQDDYEATAPTAPAVGSGSISNESGLLTLSGWLTKAVLQATSVKVYVDEIETYTAQAAPGGTDTEINDITWADTTNNGKLVVVDIVPAAYTGAINGVAGKVAYVFDTTGGTAKIELTHTNPANSVATTIIKTAGTPVNTTAATLNTNPALAVAEITTTAAKAAATAVGVTLDAYVGGSSEQTIYLYATNSSASAENSATTVSDTALAADDVVGLTIAGLTGTATISGAATSAQLATIATDMAAAWNAVATTTNTLYNVVASGSNITVTASSTAGSRADNGAIAVLFSTGTDTSTHPMVGYKIGYDRATTDNKTLSTKVIVTVMSNGKGTDADTRQAAAVAWTQKVSATLLTNVTTYTTAPSSDQYHASALSDTVSAVTEFTGTKDAGTDVNVNYLGWLK
jgi:hypothetical protein